MKSVAVYVLYPDEIAWFGVPDRRSVVRLAAAIAMVVAALETALIGVFHAGLATSQTGGVVALLTLIVAGGFRAEAAIQPGLVARRTWWQHVVNRDGQLVRFRPGDLIEKMPDGRWLLHGILIGLPTDRRDPDGPGEALADAGLEVRDHETEWRQEHVVRSRILRLGIPLGVAVWCAVLAAPAYVDGVLEMAAVTFLFVQPVALLIAGFAARPPKTRPRASVSHFRPRPARPHRLAA
jgi:NADH:ubiquinone oxidoreductase subunit K